MVTAAVVLTVAIDPKRSETHRPGLRQDSVPIFAASLANRHSSVLWVMGLIRCSKVQVCGHVERGAFALLLLLSRLDALLWRRPWVAWRFDLERPRFFCLVGVGASTSEAMVACTSSSRVSNRLLGGEVDTTEDKFVAVTPCKLFDACLRLIDSTNPFSKTAIFSLSQAKL